MPSLSDKTYFYLLALLVGLTCILLSFPSYNLKVSAALFCLWGGYGVFRFNLLESAANRPERILNETVPLSSKLIETLYVQKEKSDRENVRLFLSSGSVWVLFIFLIGLGAIAGVYMFGKGEPFRTGWPDFFRDISFLCAALVSSLSLLSFIKVPDRLLKLIFFWCCIWICILAVFAVKFQTYETVYALVFALGSALSSWRSLQLGRTSKRGVH